MKISTRQLAGILHKDHCHEIQKAGRLDKQKLKKHDNQILQKKKKKAINFFCGNQGDVNNILDDTIVSMLNVLDVWWRGFVFRDECYAFYSLFLNSFPKDVCKLTISESTDIKNRLVVAKGVGGE